MKLSDYVVSFFEEKQVKDVFMVTGGGCMHLVNSFGNSHNMRYWCAEHEQAAAMAAEAYAKMNNSLGVCLTTSGPGATNTITGVLDCWQDSTPVVFLSGQSKKKQTIIDSGILSLRQFGVQEANIIPVVSSITKYAVEIDNAKKIRYYLEKAVYEALSGRPGPVWISIPLDIQSANINPEELESFTPPPSGNTAKVSSADLNYVLDALQNARRPVIIGGHGIRLSDSCELLSQFARKYSIPIVMPIMGIDILEDTHPCNIGRIGTKGTRAGNFAMQNADLILSLGSRLAVSSVGHEYQQFAREAKVIVVDIDKEEHLKRTIDIDNLVHCDVHIFLEKLTEHIDELPPYDSWLTVCQQWKQKYPVVLPEYNDDSNGLNYYKFIELLNRYSTSTMPVVSDAGSAFYVVAQAIALKKNQRHITTGGTATMGFSLPAAIGVAVADPTAVVLSVTGDGSFMQNMQEMAVLRHHAMNVKVFVTNNNGYFSIRQTQNKFFKGNYVGESPDSGVPIAKLDRVAYAFEVPYYKLVTIEDCEKQLKEILSQKGPALIEVVVTPEMEIIPTNSSKMRDDGVLVSKPLEDMYPFLDRQEFKANMYVDTINDD